MFLASTGVLEAEVDFWEPPMIKTMEPTVEGNYHTKAVHIARGWEFLALEAAATCPQSSIF